MSNVEHVEHRISNDDLECPCLNKVDVFFCISNASGNVTRRQFGVNLVGAPYGDACVLRELGSPEGARCR